jgi:hypothetical protein
LFVVHGPAGWSRASGGRADHGLVVSLERRDGDIGQRR